MRMPSARLVLAAPLLATLVVFSGACSSSQSPPTSPPAPRQETSYSPPGYPPPQAVPGVVATATAPPGQLGAEAQPGGVWANLPPPADVPSALSQLDAAEAAILLTTGAPPGASRQQDPTTRPVAPGVTLSQDQACSIACSALASMKRSADHVCTMAGDKDAACGTARERVQRAEARVTAACPACPK